MEEDKLKIGVKEIKEIKMTDLEKDHMLKNILNSPVISRERSIKSPWAVFSVVAVMHKNRLVYYGSVFSLAVVLGGGAVFASGNSLPGNVLYPLKVSVVEPIHSALTFSPKAKAEYESKLATKRLVEAEILESRGKLDKAKEEKLSLLLEDHAEAFNKAIENDDDDDAITNFQAGLNAHAKVLELLNERNDKSEEQEKNNKISETARVSANKIRASFKENKEEEKGKDNNEDKNEDKNKERNEERKKHVKEIINGTVQELEKHTSVDLYPTRKRIIDDTHKTLEEANKYLKEADEEDEKGDTKEAYFRLLDSESSAKEAGIFLKSGLKFKEYKNEERDKDNTDWEEKED